MLQNEIDNKGNKLCVILYVDVISRVGTYLPLAKAISKEKHLCFLILTSNIFLPDEELSGCEDVLVRQIDDGNYLSKLSNVDVFFGSENAIQFAPEGSSIVTIPHSLPESWFMPSLKYDNKIAKALKYLKKLFYHEYDILKPSYAGVVSKKIAFSRYADYCVIPLKESFDSKSIAKYEKAIQDIFPPVFLQGRRKYYDIIPGGYPKIDYFDSKFKGYREKPLCKYEYIVFCSTRIKSDTEIKNMEFVIRGLLEAFNGFIIVLRPYPGDYNKIIHMSSSFSQNNRFIIDDTPSGNYYLKKACTIVNNSTSLAISFSLSTGRPSIYFGEYLGEYNKMVIDNLGYVVTGIEDIINAISHSLANKDYWYKKIMSYREKALNKPGSSSNYLAKKVPVFAKRESDPDWLSIYRKPYTDFISQEVIYSHINNLKSRGNKNKAVIKEIEDYINALKTF